MNRNIFNTISSLWGPKPREMKGQLNTDGIIQRDILLNQLLAAITFEGAPDEWDMEYLKMHLFLDGKICITDTAAGVLPLKCGTTGVNVYDRPTTCVIANVVLGNFERTIGEDCALIHFKQDYLGLWPVLELYSYFLSAADSAIAVNLMNSKVSFLGECDDKAQVQTMKKMYDQISCGEPAVFVRKGVASNFTYLNPKQSFIADQILEVRKSIRDEYLALIGIRNVNSEKKERLITAEVDAGNSEVDYNIHHWLENINAGLEVANRLYGMNLRAVKTDFAPKEVDNGDNAIQPTAGKSESV